MLWLKTKLSLIGISLLNLFQVIYTDNSYLRGRLVLIRPSSQEPLSSMFQFLHPKSFCTTFKVLVFDFNTTPKKSHQVIFSCPDVCVSIPENISRLHNFIFLYSKCCCCTGRKPEAAHPCWEYEDITSSAELWQERWWIHVIKIKEMAFCSAWWWSRWGEKKWR